MPKKSIGSKKGIRGDVQWYFPNNKRRPFHNGTVYASNSVSAIAKDYIRTNHKSPTIREVRDQFFYKCEETDILDELISNGFGDDLYFKTYD